MQDAPLFSKDSLLNFGLLAKLKLALQLSLPRFLFYFVTFVAIYAAMLLLGLILGFILGPAIGGFLTMLAFAVAMPPLLVGIAASILRCVDGDRSLVNLEEVKKPFSRFGQIVVLGLVWAAICLLISLVFALLNFIPFIGQLLTFIGMILLGMIIINVFFYLAEHENTSLGEGIKKPIALVLNNISCWFSYLVGSIIAYIPATVLLALGTTVALSGLVGVHPESSPSAFLGLGAAGVILFILSGLAAILAGVYTFFLAAISYRQSTEHEDLADHQKNLNPF